MPYWHSQSKGCTEERVKMMETSITRDEYIKAEIARIKAGGTIHQRCTMAVDGRVEAGLCLGDIPEDRAHRDSNTCSDQCRQDKKRLRRWETAKGSCRHCGHNLPKPRKAKAVKELEPFPVSGNAQPSVEQREAEEIRYVLLSVQRAFLQRYIDKNSTFEEARLLSSKETGFTLGQVTNLIDRAEEATGLRLRRS